MQTQHRSEATRWHSVISRNKQLNLEVVLKFFCFRNGFQVWGFFICLFCFKSGALYMLLANFMAMVSIIRQIYRQFLKYSCLASMPEKLFLWFICLLTFHWQSCSYSATSPKYTACLWQEEISIKISLHSVLKLLGPFHRKVVEHRKLLWCNLAVLISRKMYSLILFLLCQSQKETFFLSLSTNTTSVSISLFDKVWDSPCLENKI